jgi:hypothetical protein
MYLEFNWTAGVYFFRFGHVPTEVRGSRSVESLDEARYVLGMARLKLGKKTDTRTWKIEAVEHRDAGRQVDEAQLLRSA